MKRSCWSCKHRSAKSVKEHYDSRHGWRSFYPCAVKSTEFSTISVSEDHKACPYWEKKEEE